jgi:hypothetical protein
MPSLQALEQFKSSFLELGEEALVLSQQGRAPDGYPLPAHEPAEGADLPWNSAAPSSGGPDLDVDFPGPESGGSGLDVPEETAAGGDDGGFMDFGDLGDLLGGSSSLEEISPLTTDDALDLGGEGLDLDGGGAVPFEDDGGNPPPGLIDNLAGDLEEAREGETADFLSDFGDLPGFGEPVAEPPEEVEAEPAEASPAEELSPADAADSDRKSVV